MFELRLEVPTRDSTVLRGLHYGPDEGTAPTILAVTPYGADRFHADGVFFASRGFHFVSLDVRGRGDSDGEFVPFLNNGLDGYDAVEWLARQPWSDGDVVTYGGSYCGFVQWATAAQQPPSLRAIAPAAAVYPGVDCPGLRNVPYAYIVRWLSAVNGRRMNAGPFDDPSFWFDGVRRQLATGRPYRDLDVVSTGMRLPVFQEWLNHPEQDAYWDQFVPNRFEEITLPILTITGQYDGDQAGALAYHDRHLAANTAEVVSRHHVVIGPWDHAATRSGANSFSGLTFAEASRLDLKSLHADWYSWVLGRGSRPDLLADRVVYFHIGEDRWRSALQLPGSAKELTLQVGGPAEIVLDPTQASDEPDEENPYLRTGLSTAHVTEPLDVVDIAGRPAVRLVLSSDLPDFDLLVGLYLLRGASPARWLGEMPLRARYRDSRREATPWPSGVDVSVTVPDLPFISLRTEPGDRLAVVVEQPDRRWQINQQAGGSACDEAAPDAVVGTVRLVAAPELLLPLE